MTPRYRVDENGCWIWTGRVDDDGYGRLGFQGKDFLAHRILYCILVEVVPDDLVLDHLCRVHGCVNPDHLEPVPNAENVRRGMSGAWQRLKTHCKNGHEFTPENTGRSRKGRGRYCKACLKIKDNKRLKNPGVGRGRYPRDKRISL